MRLFDWPHRALCDRGSSRRGAKQTFVHTWADSRCNRQRSNLPVPGVLGDDPARSDPPCLALEKGRRDRPGQCRPPVLASPCPRPSRDDDHRPPRRRIRLHSARWNNHWNAKARGVKMGRERRLNARRSRVQASRRARAALHSTRTAERFDVSVSNRPPWWQRGANPASRTECPV